MSFDWGKKHTQNKRRLAPVGSPANRIYCGVSYFCVSVPENHARSSMLAAAAWLSVAQGVVITN